MSGITFPETWAAVLVNFNSSAFLQSCLTALYANSVQPTDVVLVDNASTDDSLQEIAAWPQVIVERNTVNLGFAGGANRGVARTDAPVVVILNPDVEVDRDFGAALLAVFSSSPKLGAAGAKLRYPDSDVLQHAGGELFWPLLTTGHRGYRQHDSEQWNVATAVDFVTGGAMALRRDAFEQIDGFDERFWPAYYEDVDICLRLRDAGWDVRYQPELRATHVESVTLGQSLEYFRAFHRNRLRLAIKRFSADDWWSRFIPAEVLRMRGELSAMTDGSWPVRSGASALEETARASAPPYNGNSPLFDGAPLAQLMDALGELQARREVVAPADTSEGGGFRAGLMRKLFGRQQVFNDAVVRAFQAQDRVNRELTVQILLALLDLSWRDAHLETPQPRPPSDTPRTGF